ncbi:uncharacterized protein LOC144472243 [Augochlora pura]
MSPVGLAFLGLISVALAKPGIFTSPLIATLTPGAPVGPDGRVVDTPEVAVAKAAHAAAQVNERINLANEAARSSVALEAAVINPTASLVVGGPTAVLVPGAPIGPDGRVVDTAEVAVAKANHAAAQVNERISLANEAVRSAAADLTRPVVITGGVITAAGPVTTVGPDGRVQDTPAVAAAKAAHAAAQINERINLANEAARSGTATIVTAGQTVSVPILTGNAVLVQGAPIGPDGRVQDTPEVAVAKAAHVSAHINEKLNLANEAAKSADVVALTAPGLAYGRVLY